MSEAIVIDTVEAILEQHDVFLIDQYGVLHDGHRPYHGVIETITMLKNKGKLAILLSNSARDSNYARQKITRVGFDAELFTDIITSGETIYNLFKTKWSNWLNKYCLAYCENDDTQLLDKLQIALVDDAHKADFLFIGGSANSTNQQQIMQSLTVACQRGLTMFCANPDTHSPDVVNNSKMPGIIAQKYLELGGEVIYVGKPYASIFEFAAARNNFALDKKVVMVGDGLHFDIRGACERGIHSLFITGGIHREHFSAEQSKADIVQMTKQLSPNYMPNYILPRFV